MRGKILECFQHIGIIADDTEENFEIGQYLTDSMTFISFIVGIESAFCIDISEEYLVPDRLSTFQDVCNMIADSQSTDAVYP